MTDAAVGHARRRRDLETAGGRRVGHCGMRLSGGDHILALDEAAGVRPGRDMPEDDVVG